MALYPCSRLSVSRQVRYVVASFTSRVGICRKIKLSLRVLPKRAHTKPIQHPYSCPSPSRHVRSSEHFSHWLIFDVLYVAPLADTMFDDRDGRGSFFFVSHHVWICPMLGFLRVFFAACRKWRFSACGDSVRSRTGIPGR